MKEMPPTVYLGAALLLVVVGVMAAQSHGAQFAVQGGTDPKLLAAQTAAYQAQVEGDNARITTGTAALLSYQAQRDGYDLGKLTLQKQAQSEKANLDAQERMFNTGVAASERAQTSQQKAQLDAQNSQQSAAQSQQTTGGFFDFITTAAKILLPILFV